MSKYPWDQWFDGRVWYLRRGTDYTCEDASIRGTAHATITRMHGGSIRLATAYVFGDGVDGLLIQAFDGYGTWRPNLHTFPHSKIRAKQANDNAR